MSSRARADSIKLGGVLVAFSLLLSFPLLANAAAKRVKGDIWVVDAGNNNIVKVATTWKKNKKTKVAVTDVIGGFNKPTEIAAAEDVVLVLNSGNNTVSVVDTKTNTIVSTVKTGKNSRSVAVSPDGTLGFVAQGRSLLRIIDTGISSNAPAKVIKILKVGRTPSKVRVDQTGTWAVTANVGNNSISVVTIDQALALSAGASKAGVKTIKKGICDLTGGLDVAAQGLFGSWALWTCIQAHFQEMFLGDQRVFPQFGIGGGLTHVSNAFYVPECIGSGDAAVTAGLVGTGEDENEHAPLRVGAALGGRSVFFFDFIKATIVGPGRAHSRFATADGDKLTVYSVFWPLDKTGKSIPTPPSVTVTGVDSAEARDLFNCK